MSVTNTDSNLNRDLVSRSNSCPFNTLPKELFDEIFDYLPLDDLQNFSSSNWTMKREIRENISFLTRNFFEALGKTLNPETAQRKKNILSKISEEISHSIPIKPYVFYFHNHSIELLKDLKKEEIRSLAKSVVPPTFFRNIFRPAFLEGQMEEILKGSSDSRDEKLEEIGIEFARIGFFKKSKLITDKIPGSSGKEKIYFEMADFLGRNGQMEQAIQFAVSVSQFRFISKIFDEWIKKNQIEKARNALSWIGSPSLKDMCRFKIANHLIEKDNLLEALSEARLISNSDQKDDVYFSVSKEFLKKNEIKQAIDLGHQVKANWQKIKIFIEISDFLKKDTEARIEAALLFPIDWDIQSSHLAYICDDLIKESKFERACSVALLIRDQQKKDQCLNSIFEILEEGGELEILYRLKPLVDPPIEMRVLSSICKIEAISGEMEKAMKNLHSILDQSIVDSTLSRISLSFAIKREFEEAIRTAQMISDKELRKCSLKDVDQSKSDFCSELLEIENFQQAIEIAKTISDSAIKKQIALQFAIQKKFDEGVEIAATISKESIRNKALSEIGRRKSLNQSKNKRKINEID